MGYLFEVRREVAVGRQGVGCLPTESDHCYLGQATSLDDGIDKVSRPDVDPGHTNFACNGN